METQVRTPQMVFMQPQRLIVPLFQRPYVWNEENQWAPLWADVTRVAERLMADPHAKHQPHFLGAVVLQQVQNQTGSMQERTVIDGQQRLTTLQLLLDALHAELDAVGATQAAMRIEALVTNAEPFWEGADDRFKVWPTNRDRAAFNEVMGASPPVAYSDLANTSARLVAAHRYFAEMAREWLRRNADEGVADRAVALERTVRELLQIVVIDLTADENAQEIFETLNARGAQLTAADLIKNFIFQRLMESGANVEAAYEKNWKEFESGFWETEVSSGRIRYSRSSIFLNHWLIAETGEEIVAREVFARFKLYADHQSDTPMPQLLERLRRSAVVYRSFVEAAGNLTGPIDRLGLFAYRTSTLESDVFKPLILLLFDPEQPPFRRHRSRGRSMCWRVGSCAGCWSVHRPARTRRSQRNSSPSSASPHETPQVTRSNPSFATSQSSAVTGPTTRSFATSCAGCWRTRDCGEDDCEWCSNRSRITGGVGRGPQKGSAANASPGGSTPSST